MAPGPDLEYRHADTTHRRDKTFYFIAGIVITAVGGALTIGGAALVVRAWLGRVDDQMGMVMLPPGGLLGWLGLSVLRDARRRTR